MKTILKLLLLTFLVTFIIKNFSNPLKADSSDQSKSNPEDCVHIPGMLKELLKRGEKFYAGGKFDAALRCFTSFIYDSPKKTQNKEEMESLSSAYIFKGAIETLKGIYPESIKSYQESLEIMQSEPLNHKENENPEVQQLFAKIYNNIYISASHDKRDILAKEYKAKHDRLRSLAAKDGRVLAVDPFERGSIYFGEGIYNMEKGVQLVKMEDRTSANPYLVKAIESLKNAEREYLNTKDGINKSVMRISTLLNQSVTLDATGKPEEAKKQFELALEEKEKSKVDERYLETMSQVIIKMVSIQREINKSEPGKYKEEEIKQNSEYARKIQEIINPKLKDCDPPVGIINITLANYYLDEGKDLFFKKNYDLAKKSVSCAERYIPTDNEENTVNLEAKKLLIQILSLQKDINKKLKNIDEAKKLLVEIQDLIREYYLYTNTIGIDKENEIKREKYREYFEESFTLTMKSNEYRNAFISSEKFRSITISEFINLNVALSNPRIDDSARRKIINLKKKMNKKAAESVAFKFIGLDITTISRQLNTLTTEFEQLDYSLRKRNSNYKKTRENADLSFQVEDLINSLRIANKTMLHFFFSQDEKRKSKLFVSILGSKSPNCQGICVHSYDNLLESEISEKIKFYKLLVSINPKKIKDSKKQIYALVNDGAVKIVGDNEKRSKVFQYLENRKVEMNKPFFCPDWEETEESLKECKVYIIPKELSATWIDDLSKNLHEQILSPLYKNNYIQRESKKNKADNLVISPDNSLYLLPFGTLKDENGAYFLDSHAYSFSPSAEAWYYNYSRYKNSNHAKVIDSVIIGNPLSLESYPNYCKSNSAEVNSVSENLKKLVCTKIESIEDHKDEIERIQNSFLALNKKVKTPKDKLEDVSENDVIVLSGEEANKKNLFTILNLSDDTYLRYVHFVGHGYNNLQNPGLNSILLTPDFELKTNDGKADDVESQSLSRYLTEADVMGMNFASELVTLSSCSATSGFDTEAEGNVGLPRAFILSGARNVLGPLWNVNSTKTQEILVAFYNKMNKKRSQEKSNDFENESKILQETLIEFRKKDKDYSSPYYWGAFTIYGE